MGWRDWVVRSAYTLVVFAALANVALHIACVADTKGVGQPVASCRPSTADGKHRWSDRTFLSEASMNIETQKAVGRRSMPPSFPFRKHRVPPRPEGAADRLHTPTPTVGPLQGSLTTRLPSHQENPIFAQTQQTPLPNTALVFAAPPSHPHLANNSVL